MTVVIATKIRSRREHELQEILVLSLSLIMLANNYTLRSEERTARVF